MKTTGLNSRKEHLEALERLLDIMDELREKCPWDRKQTNQSLREHTLEETYELAEALVSENNNDIKEELGDLLLHIFFYSKIGSEKKAFDIADVAHAISEKLIRRHPHIYGDVNVENEDEVKQNWEALKLKEKKDKKTLDGVPSALPSMIKAHRLQEKAAGVGFDWPDKEEVWDKLEEELREFREAGKSGNQEKIEEEFGDVLFSMINYSRFLNIKPDNALEKTNQKFIRRFNYIESQALHEGKKINEFTLEEMEIHWQNAKGQVN